MRKYKIIAAALCAAMIVTSATGCGTKKKSENTKVSSEVKNKTEEKTDCSSYVTLGDYSNIELKTKDIDSEVENQIKTNIKNTGKYNKVKKGKVKKGDILNIYYVGKINGKAFEGGSCTKKTNPSGYDLEIGSNSFIDGFEDALIGKEIGKKHDIKVTFPESYPQNEDLQGKPAVFTVTINFKEDYPELSDKFVTSNFKGFSEDYKDTAEDYTKYIRSGVIKSQAWSKVKETSKVKDKYPTTRVNSTKKKIKTSITSYLKQVGYSLEDYLKAQNTSEDDFNEQLETKAKEDVAQQLIYGAIAEKENITVSDEDYKKELKSYMKQYSCKDEKALKKLFSEQYGADVEDTIKEDILFNNVKDYIVKNVKES